MPIEGTSNEPQSPLSSQPPFPAKGWKGFKREQEVHLLSQQSPSEIIMESEDQSWRKEKTQIF